MKFSRKIRRDLCAVVALCLILSCVGITAFTADSDCTKGNCAGTYTNGICSLNNTHYEAAPVDNGVYQISNAGQLYWFAELVNSGENEYERDNGDEYNAVLTADIVVGEDQVDWTPIGLYTSATEYVRYSGTFDGNGHTIYGLHYLNQTYTGRTVGLFGCLDSNGTVKNVSIADSSFIGATDVAGVVSHNYGGTVIGCRNGAVVSGTGNAGGIVSRNMDGGSVISCSNTGAVSGAHTGGIAADNEKDSRVEKCANSGAVSGTSSVGGIVGGNRGTVTLSHNTGDVTASGTHVGGVVGNHIAGTISASGNRGAVSGASDYIGGVAGLCSGSVIINSYNSGSVTGGAKSDSVGGVAGEVDGTYTAAAAVTGCYNIGAVTGRGLVGEVVGILGYQNTTNTATVENCYYQADSETDALDGTTAVAAAKFASGEMAYTMNGSTSTGDALVWYQNIDAENAEADISPVPDDTHGVVYYGYPDCSTNMGFTNFEPVDGQTGPHKDENGDYKCDICDKELEKPVEPSDPSNPSEPNESDPTGPSQPGESDPTSPSDPSEPSEPKYEVPECGKDETCTLSQFSDIKVDDWYHDGIHFCVDEGIMNGMGDGVFAPNEPTTRAQLVTMLYRLEGKPGIEGKTEPFTDVNEGEWYYDAIVWAYSNKVVNGMTETTFEPNGSVTREQVATILYRYLGSPEGTGKLDEYPDVDKVQSYAKDALVWAVGEGLINGVAQADGTSLLDPAGNATRAQIATILMRYLTAE